MCGVEWGRGGGGRTLEKRHINILSWLPGRAAVPWKDRDNTGQPSLVSHSFIKGGKLLGEVCFGWIWLGGGGASCGITVNA